MSLILNKAPKIEQVVPYSAFLVSHDGCTVGTKKVWFYAALRDRIRPYPKKLFFDFFEKIFLPFFSKKIGSKKSKKVFVNFWLEIDIARNS